MNVKLIASRKGSTIIDFETGQKTKFKSISLAKKESFKIQKGNGGLGCGSVQVI